jgi:hypothetical protein
MLHVAECVYMHTPRDDNHYICATPTCCWSRHWSMACPADSASCMPLDAVCAVVWLRHWWACRRAAKHMCMHTTAHCNADQCIGCTWGASAAGEHMPPPLVGAMQGSFRCRAVAREVAARSGTGVRSQRMPRAAAPWLPVPAAADVSASYSSAAIWQLDATSSVLQWPTSSLCAILMETIATAAATASPCSGPLLLIAAHHRNTNLQQSLTSSLLVLHLLTSRVSPCAGGTVSDKGPGAAGAAARIRQPCSSARSRRRGAVHVPGAAAAQHRAGTR